MNLSLPQLHPAARAALALPAFDTQEWRADFARGIRAALSAEGTRPRYLRAAAAALRNALGPSALFEIARPGESDNAKLAKNRAVTLAFTGASGADSEAYNPCPALGACAAYCVLGRTCGKARAFPEHIIGARSRRLRAMREHPVAAGVEFVRAAAAAARLARAEGLRTVARLNVGTDIGFEAIAEVDATFVRFDIDAYAYTKRPAAVRAAMRDRGYVGRTRIVYSWSERASESLAAEYLRSGGNVAAVIAGIGRAAATDVVAGITIDGETFPTIDGDATDDRTLDRSGHVILLRGKGTLERADDPHGFALSMTDPRIVRA
jgi:hypothetical protein